MTGKLLSFFGIRTPLLSYHDHSSERAEEKILERLNKGEAVALVSDAGTPLVSDPGFPLVRRCLEEDISVTAVPGASAALTALQISGLPSDRFFFQGFLPSRSSARKTALQDIKGVPASLIFFESPRRLAESLADMEAVFGDRPAAVCRELTKLFEEVRRGTLKELAHAYKEEGAPKGEVVVVVGPADKHKAALDEASLDGLIRQSLETASARDAAQTVAAATGLPRRQVYGRVLDLLKEKDT